MNRAPEPAHDYIVVGSGAGGGTLAARLAEAGYRVLLIEAGPDPAALASGRHAEDYRVPAFHAMASENEAFAWPYIVAHFDEPSPAVNENAEKRGIFYPRAAALGGCTAHNAMIFMPPPDRDWDELAALSGDPAWGAASIRRFRRLVERCRHRPLQRLLAGLGYDPTGHGWSGWLTVEKALPLKAMGDLWLVRALARIAVAGLGGRPGWRGRIAAFAGNRGDPNDQGRPAHDQLCYLPLATRFHTRTGTRERLLSVQRRHPDRLEIMTECLTTEVLFEGNRAVGIAWQRGSGLWRDPAVPPAQQGHSYAAREVILACGTFATPQLLMLSGIGSRAVLEKLGIPVRSELPQVGRNLQDRYEIGVVHGMTRPWRSLRGASFAPDDPLHRRWRWLRRGMYTSNGVAVAALRRSARAEHEDPDLILMGLLGRFSGYRSGYANAIWPGLDGFTWAVLKGQTRNRAGSVMPTSRDPRVPPAITFRNFAQGGEADLDALVEGVEMARALSRPLLQAGLIATEEQPGPGLTGGALREWIRCRAWGHHACGTAAIGEVVDARGQVFGVRGLRVADASIFPRIPGLFIAAAVMLAAEKLAADVMADASSAAEDRLKSPQPG